MPLLRGRSQRLGQQHKLLDPQGQFATPGAEDLPLDSDQIAQVELEQPLHPRLAQLVDATLELNSPRPVDQVDEGHPPLTAPGGDPPGDAVPALGLLARGQRPELLADARDRLDAVELVRKRFDPGVAQRLQLAAPVREDAGVLFRWLVADPRNATSRRRSW